MVLSYPRYANSYFQKKLFHRQLAVIVSMMRPDASNAVGKSEEVCISDGSRS